jgi:hypothetical protein
VIESSEWFRFRGREKERSFCGSASLKRMGACSKAMRGVDGFPNSVSGVSRYERFLADGFFLAEVFE